MQRVLDEILDGALFFNQLHKTFHDFPVLVRVGVEFLGFFSATRFWQEFAGEGKAEVIGINEFSPTVLLG